jgi:hypothetical protein
MGLYVCIWVNFADTCVDLVHALLQLSPGKRPFYQRGQWGDVPDSLYFVSLSVPPPGLEAK